LFSRDESPQQMEEMTCPGMYWKSWLFLRYLLLYFVVWFAELLKRLIGSITSQNSLDLFNRIQILPLPREYIFSLLNFVNSNQDHFQANSVVHSVNTRNKDHIRRPIANLTGFQKSTYYSGINISNSVPSGLKSLINEKATFK
jgi:hypothetical protein